MRDVQQLEARRSQVGHDARAARAGDRAIRFWGAVENLNISGGEPTTRNDLPEMVEMFQRHLPRMRKIGINTTGLTPHRAIPMLTRIVEFCAAHDLLISIRVSLDGIGDVHDQVRHVKRGFDKACKTIEAMQALAEKHPNFQFGIASTIFATNLEDAQNILTWARTKKLDIVFNMLRFTDAMLNNKELEEHDRLPRSAKKSSCGSSSSTACRRNRS